MTVLNHAVTGAVVAVAINHPLLALPAAFLSHFVVDFLPHWNYKVPGRASYRQLAIGFDATVSAVLLVILAWFFAEKPWLVFMGGSLAILPDMMWLPHVLYNKPPLTDKQTPLHKLRRFHMGIQRSETAAGGFAEIGWFIVMLVVFFRITG